MNGDRPDGGRRPQTCVSCGKKSVSIHHIFVSLRRKVYDKDDKDLIWIFLRGFSIPMCKTCLRKYRRLVLSIPIITSVVGIGIFVGGIIGGIFDEIPFPFVLLFLLGLISVLAGFALSFVVQPPFEKINCRELAELRSEGYVSDTLIWPREVQDEKDVASWHKRVLHGGPSACNACKWFNWSWTEYIVYKWIGEIDPEGGRTFNGSEILNADEEIIRIKESEALSWKNALGSLKPPNGVSIFALKGSQGYCIVCRRWRMGLIIILLPWIMVSGYALIQVIQSLASTSNVSVSIVLLSGGAFVLGCTLLVDELINKTILMLTPEGGRFIENGIFENHWDIPLSP